MRCLAVIEVVLSETNNADRSDAWLRKRFRLPEEDDITKTFLCTQPTGAFLQMVDLGLVASEK